VPARPGTVEDEAITPRPLGRTLSSAEFWALMERWRVPDATTLELIECPGKLGALGKRPRFRFVTSQRRITAYLAELDSALVAAGHGPAWLRRKNWAAPFNGRTPLGLMVAGGKNGIGEVLRFVHAAVLRKSLR
jgi:hypothetical protein